MNRPGCAAHGDLSRARNVRLESDVTPHLKVCTTRLLLARPTSRHSADLTAPNSHVSRPSIKRS